MQDVRPPAVAGAFYPADRIALRDHVDALLASASSPESGMRLSTDGPSSESTSNEKAEDDVPPKALVVPHARYAYSGATAASAYAQLRHSRDSRTPITRVVLVGPCHRIRVAGIAVPDAESMETPLGRVTIDRTALASIEANPRVVVSADAHAKEHSIEVQLPFLQRVLGDGFAVVPLGVGDATAEEVAAVLEALWGGAETLIVVSTDLSHYLPYAIARGVDQYTAQRVLELSPMLDPSEACGAMALNGLLIAARHKHLHPALLDLRSSGDSGDTAGPRHGVVGYGAFGFFEEKHHAA